MCGIVGYWNLNNKSSSSILIEEMINTIKKRGPDDQGIWIGNEKTIFFGHSRLAIQDLTFAGNQPLKSFNNKWVILFNGEIYNHNKLRGDLENINWAGHSDTETIAEYINKFGIDRFRQNADGMYALAALNIPSKKLYLMRDNFGEKPLYFFSEHNNICFSSTLEAIKIYKKDNLEIDQNSVANFINYGFMPDNKSIYEKVISISPGQMLQIEVMDNKFLVTSKKNNLYKNNQNVIIKKSDKNDLDEIENLISESIKSRLIGDLKVGCFLSGGIDSSLVAALAQKHLNGTLETFSIGFESSGFDESIFAQEVAEILQTKHKSYFLEDKDILKVATNLKFAFDEPFADQSQLAMLFLCDKVRHEGDLKVALSGDGGDELFCGYNRYTNGYDLYKTLKGNNLLRKSLFILKLTPFEFIDRILHSLPRKIRFSATRNLAFKLRKVLNCKNLESYYETLISRDNKNIIKDQVLINKLQNSLIEKISNILSDFEDKDPRTKLMIIDEKIYLPNDILVKSDRSSMNFGLEVRSPFLEPNIHNWCRTKGEKIQYSNNKSKYVLKRLLAKNIPNYKFDRPKMGFGVPLDYWLRTCLKDWAETIIFSKNLKNDPIINNNILLKKWNNHLKGQSQALSLWPVIIYGSWRYNI